MPGVNIMNRNHALVVVRFSGLGLKDASDALKRDRDVVLAAVRRAHASMDLQGDKEVAFVALTNDPECIQHIPDELKGGRSADALLAYLKAEIISTLPERYRVGARELLKTKAHISSEISFVLQDRGLSDVFKMEWARRTLTPEDMLAYRDNLSKLLATKVILQLCDGGIHSARFSELCTRENIDGLSRSIAYSFEWLRY